MPATRIVRFGRFFKVFIPIRTGSGETPTYRKAAHPELTLTGIYNVLEKLRAETPLTDKVQCQICRAVPNLPVLLKLKP